MERNQWQSSAECAYGATPINGDELAALIPKHISLQSELNEWEQTNILEAEKWSFDQSHSDILSLQFIQKLHLKMFGETWAWAGQFRKTQKNIGVAPHEISSELFKLCKDVQFQLEKHTFSLDEIAMRLHHRLVWIHPFPNGNGRHARLFTDIFLTSLKQQKFTWGRDSLINQSQTRDAYIKALQQADQHNYKPLLEFVKN